MSKKYSHLEVQNQHKRDVFWQILLPVILGGLALIALGILAVISLQTGFDSTARWAHISTMWLLLPVFLAGLVTFILLTGLIVAVVKVYQILPQYSLIIQETVQNASDRIQSLINKTTQPVMLIQSNKAAIHRFWVALQYAILGGLKD